VARTQSDTDINVKRKLAALKRHMERIEAVADFLTRNPAVAERSTLRRMSTGTGLCFEDKGYIRPVGADPVLLQLEKHIEDWGSDDSSERIVCRDIRFLSSEQLGDVLREIRIDLSKPYDDEEEEED
jgi:hypothetical protein